MPRADTISVSLDVSTAAKIDRLAQVLHRGGDRWGSRAAVIAVLASTEYPRWFDASTDAAMLAARTAVLIDQLKTRSARRRTTSRPATHRQRQRQ